MSLLPTDILLLLVLLLVETHFVPGLTHIWYIINIRGQIQLQQILFTDRVHPICTLHQQVLILVLAILDGLHGFIETL